MEGLDAGGRRERPAKVRVEGTRVSTSGRKGMYRAMAVAAGLAALFAGRASAARHDKGEVANGKFTPTLPPSAQFGPDPSRSCPTAGTASVFSSEVAAVARDHQLPLPKPDGQLCAMAETLLGWPDDNPPERVMSFVAQYFGLPTASRYIIAVIDTEDSLVLAQRMGESMPNLLKNAVQPVYGLATERFAKGRTRIVLLVLDSSVAIDPLPRRLALGEAATLSGRLLGEFENPKVYVSDTIGRLQVVESPPGKAFKAELKCADKAGRIHVEIRGQLGGKPRVLANFPVACGTELPGSVAMTLAAWPTDTGEQAKKVAEAINAERAAAGIAPLAWDEAVAGVARATADGLASGKPVELAELLVKAGVPSPVVLENPGQSRTADDAQQKLLASPAHRANLMNTEVTHVGVGVATTVDAAGLPLVTLAEVFVKELPTVDVEKAREQLRDAIAARRTAEKLAPLASDKALEDAAEKYAQELAQAKGDLPTQRDEELASSLNKGFANVRMVLGPTTDPVSFAKDSKALATGKFLGVGVAQGENARLGKNTCYVVVLIGSPREAAAKDKGKQKK